MNLSPDWVRVFSQMQWEAKHWMDVGHATAPDTHIMTWAKEFGYVVFTHDLDFGALLAATGAIAPSVVQMRCEDTRPASMGNIVISAMLSHEEALTAGALVTIDPRRMRVTLLPLKRNELT